MTSFAYTRFGDPDVLQHADAGVRAGFPVLYASGLSVGVSLSMTRRLEITGLTLIALLPFAALGVCRPARSHSAARRGARPVRSASPRGPRC
jgi:hypothetical protein